MKIVFFGYQWWGYLSLKALIDTHNDILAVITHEKGQESWYPYIGDLAKENNIETLIFEKIDQKGIDFIRQLQPDLILSVGYRKIIPKAILDIPTEGAINLHGSLLPKYRGGAVLNWAIINNENRIGVTAHMMVEKFDAGDIVNQKEVEVRFEDSVFDVYKRTLSLYPEIVLEIVEKIKNKTIIRIPQNEAEATYVKQRKPENGIIDWNKNSLNLYNWIRALTFPYPGAFSFINKNKIIIWDSNIHDQVYSPKIEVGTIVGSNNKGIIVKTKDKALVITTVQINNGDRIKAVNLLQDKIIQRGDKFGV